MSISASSGLASNVFRRMCSHNFIYDSKKLNQVMRTAREQNLWEVVNLFSPT